MQWWICHNQQHVTAERECTAVPYSDTSQYDGVCRPHKLTLVGLVPESTSAKRVEKFICKSAKHKQINMACTSELWPRSTVTSGPTTDTPHEWIPGYEPGSWVTLRMQVDPDRPRTSGSADVWLKCESFTYRLPRSALIGPADPPYPPEPDRKSILRSQDGSDMIVFDNGSWRRPGAMVGLEWEDTWSNYGPFDVFTPSGEVKL